MEATRKMSRTAMTSSEKLVVFASSLGTVFEWYDFLLVGALAAEISKHFFSGVNRGGIHLYAPELCCGLRDTTAGCGGVWAHRRSGWSQIHVSDHHRVDG